MSLIVRRLIAVILVSSSALIISMQEGEKLKLKTTQRPSDTECSLEASLRDAASYVAKQWGFRGRFRFRYILGKGKSTIPVCSFELKDGTKIKVKPGNIPLTEALVYTACTRPCTLLLQKIMAGWTSGKSVTNPAILRTSCHALYDQTPLDYIYQTYGKSSGIYKTALDFLSRWKKMQRDTEAI